MSVIQNRPDEMVTVIFGASEKEPTLSTQVFCAFLGGVAGNQGTKPGAGLVMQGLEPGQVWTSVQDIRLVGPRVHLMFCKPASIDLTIAQLLKAKEWLISEQNRLKKEEALRAKSESTKSKRNKRRNKAKGVVRAQPVKAGKRHSK